MPILDQPVRLNPRTRMPYSDPRAFPRLWTPVQRHIWDRASFTVPADVPDERVKQAGDRYRMKYGKALEVQGFDVLGMGWPEEDRSVLARGTTDPDRRRYIIWAKIRRRPVEVHVDVPDEDVPIYQKAGYRLTE